MILWLKLNIYPLLLTALCLLMTYLLFFWQWLNKHDWLFYGTACAIIYTVYKTVYIYGRYLHKILIYKRLIESGKKRFDYRLFYPYMDSPCMRHVVFFALLEIGKASEYSKIKKAYRNIPLISYNTSPRIATVEFNNRRLQLKIKNPDENMF